MEIHLPLRNMEAEAITISVVWQAKGKSESGDPMVSFEAFHENPTLL